MFTWIYELPIWLDFLLITGSAVGLTVTAILLSRQAVQRVFGPEPGWDETVTMVLTGAVPHAAARRSHRLHARRARCRLARAARGRGADGGTALVTRFQDHLLAFRPAAGAEEITKGGIPDVLWWTWTIRSVGS
ncbi:hypothetical protein ACIGO9_33485 [Nocardia asteroides]|uniref:hypothetical protein n=1 Tax=Nocardia asteroides TaxID=1824 RepID=UPI0037C893A3